MEIHTFIADSAPDVVAQIRGRLGAQALVLNVRRLPVEGLARFWMKPRIEVLACLPEEPPAPPCPPANNALTELKQAVAELKQKIEDRPSAGIVSTGPAPLSYEFKKGASPVPAPARRRLQASPGGWSILSLLESSGLLPIHAERILEELKTRHGEPPPDTPSKQIELACAALARAWRPARRPRSHAHVFIGAPGAGKTTCLCKWLAHTVLLQNQPARVWRLDGRNANTAEMLSIYAEILGAPLERLQPNEFDANEETLFIDLPGVNWTDAAAVQELTQRVGRLPAAEIHLVLNAAYEVPALLAQVRAFSALPVSGLIFTHLDEEPRWGKLWNFVLGTNYSIAYLGGGQNIPGEFHPASPERIFSRQFCPETRVFANSQPNETAGKAPA